MTNRLLTDKDLDDIELQISDGKIRGRNNILNALIEAQDAKTASIVRADIISDINKYGFWFEHFDERGEYQGEYIRISEAVYEALKQGEMPK